MPDINYLMTLFIFVLGSITVILSVLVSIKFSSYKLSLEGKAKKLSSAVAWQLAGEAVIGFGTLVFSVAAFMGVLESWDLALQSFIRLVMFLATGITTLHLHKTLNHMGS